MPLTLTPSHGKREPKDFSLPRWEGIKGRVVFTVAAEKVHLGHR
jgi:hypothetical protein